MLGRGMDSVQSGIDIRSVCLEHSDWKGDDTKWGWRGRHLADHRGP